MLNLDEMRRNLEELLTGHEIDRLKFSYLGALQDSTQNIHYSDGLGVSVIFYFPIHIYNDGPEAVINWIKNAYEISIDMIEEGYGI
ncbi:MAG: hypothetical protein QXL01_00850 [Thermoplasmatales archaeon]